ncbi:MAG: hypothetical protein K1X57_14385 [Gemmataceae bacterium]|nr:hypothetical protein [Gemmataceae bacterium]
MSLKSAVWRWAYKSWGSCAPADQPGYSLLVPVPGDLPVFLELALAVLRRQDATHRVETLVIPDVCSPRMRAIVERESAGWPGPLRLVELPLPDRLIPQWMNRPHHNHWLQLINGARRASARHALLHDADLFLDDSTLLRRQYEACVAGDYSCFGVNRVWDDWFAQRGLNLAATWELFFSVPWLRSFPPHMHLGHDDVWNGEPHTFDTTLFPQCQTPAGKIAWNTPPGGMVHFNYVICSYRYFRDARGPYADDNFRILLIRILIDLFDPGPDEYGLPGVDELALGITDPTARVHYTTPAAGANYPEFRVKFAELLATKLLNATQRDRALAILAPFDRRWPMP